VAIIHYGVLRLFAAAGANFVKLKTVQYKNRFFLLIYNFILNMPRNLLRKRTYSQRRPAKYTKPKRSSYLPVRKSWNSSYKKRTYRGRYSGLRKYKAG